MGWFKSDAKFEGQDKIIKVLIESLLTDSDTVIEIDFTNATFDLYNDEQHTSVAIDSIGVKVDIVKQGQIIALDSKMTDVQLTALKNAVAEEATKRRAQKRTEKFLNREKALTETINSIISKNGTNNSERN